MKRLANYLAAAAFGAALTAIVVRDRIRRERVHATRVVLNTYGEKQRLRADKERLERLLDESRANLATANAVLRDGQ